MAEQNRLNPYGLDGARDYPHSPARLDVPKWSENCLFQGYDPAQKVFFYHHHGLVASDPRLWCGDFWLAFGDGRFLSSKTYGRNELLRGMSDGTLHFECIEPLRSWRLTFNGAAFLTTRESNRKRFVGVDLVPVPVEFDVVWEGIAPVHQIVGKVASDVAFAADGQHYEQGGVFRGQVRVCGEEFSVSGPGYRDHSVGPRDLSTGTAHTWTVATFPKSGRVFATGNMNETASFGYIVEDGMLHEAEVIEAPYWPKGAPDFAATRFAVRVKANGREITVHGEIVPVGMHWTIFHPSQFCPGRAPEREVAEKLWAGRETAVKYTWDGEETYGLLEISRRQG